MAVGALLLVLTAAAAVAHEFINCDGGYCEGDRHDNIIDGTEKRDKVEAKAGNDEIWGYGSPQDKRDVLYGQGDNDDIYGGRDDDYLSGGSGNDDIYDEAGPRSGDDADVDKVYGGSGNDYINVADGDGRDEVDCGEGSDDVVVRDDGDDADNCEDRDPASSASADSATVSAQQYGEETTETSS